MPYLTAAVALVGVLCLLDLALTLGIIRRMRADISRAYPLPPVALGPGSSIGEFSVMTIDGEMVSDASLTGLVGFFSANCRPCHEALPGFIAYAAGLGRHNVLAVIGGDDELAPRALGPVARLVTADLAGGPIAAAFRNTTTPALYLIDNDHRVLAASGRADDLPVMAPDPDVRPKE